MKKYYSFILLLVFIICFSMEGHAESIQLQSPSNGATVNIVNKKIRNWWINYKFGTTQNKKKQGFTSPNPIILKNRRIISVDGGMTALRDGQLNALIIPPGGSEDFSFVSVDNFPKRIAQNSQNAGLERHLIQEPDNRVKVLKTSGDMCYCRQERTEQNFWIPKVFLTKRADGSCYTEDFTDYQLKVTYGDEVSVVLETSRGAIVKRDGVTGWYYGLLQ